MKTRAFVLGVALIAGGVVPGRGAPRPGLVITSVVVEGDRLYIEGINFEGRKGAEVMVWLSGEPLSVESATDTLVVARLPLPPESMSAGSYRLTLSRGPAEVQHDSFSVTVGAVGPPGPRGEPGAPGPFGPPSLDALRGLPCNLEEMPGTTEVTYSPSGSVLITCEAGGPQQCRPQSCVDAVLTLEAFLEGGVCPPATTVSCRAYQCNTAGDACLTRCSADSECTSGFRCSAAGRCVSDLPPPGDQVHVVINEVDYDQPSTDTTEFVELYNAGSLAADLAPLVLVLVNGANGAEYARVDLSGVLAPGGFAVVAPPGLEGVPAEALQFPFPAAENNIQNGPDGIALYDTVVASMVDSISYEGIVAWNVPDGGGATLSLAEGGSAAPADTGEGSLARFPDGADADDGATDWAFATVPSPGSPNAE
jgi:hypothetical protein